MTNEYLGVLVFCALAGTVAGGFVLLASILGPKKPSKVKSEPFECGEPAFSVSAGHLSIKFYLTAILFILFDVELVFLYPWAVVFRDRLLRDGVHGDGLLALRRRPLRRRFAEILPAPGGRALRGRNDQPQAGARA